MRDGDRWCVRRSADPSPACIRTSVAGSTALVASSSTSTSAAARCARASATICRSPADNRSPRCPTSVSRPSGMSANQSPSPSSANDRLASAAAVGGSTSRRSPYATFWAIVPSKRKPSWGTSTTRDRTVARLSRPDRPRPAAPARSAARTGTAGRVWSFPSRSPRRPPPLSALGPRGRRRAGSSDPRHRRSRRDAGRPRPARAGWARRRRPGRRSQRRCRSRRAPAANRRGRSGAR